MEPIQNAANNNKMERAVVADNVLHSYEDEVEVTSSAQLHPLLDVEAPVDVKEDVRSTERKQRVSSALDCEPFRNDLENIIGQGIPSPITTAYKYGAFIQQQHHHNLIQQQQHHPMQQPHHHQQQQRQPQHHSSKLYNNTIPIDDIHRFGSMNTCTMDETEIILRCKVASLCRLIGSLRDDNEAGLLCSTHITARLSESQELFLVNPYGLMLSEITAKSLLKVDTAGNLVNEDGSRSPAGHGENGLIVYNRASFAIHTAIHRTRFDVKCIIHIHHLPVVTISCLKAGLLPLCREALILGGISYHDSHEASIDDHENIKKILCEELGPFNKILVWRNHGMSICGESVQDAWHLTTNALKACQVQCGAMCVGLDNLNIPSEAVQKEMIEASRGNLPSVCDSNRATCEYEFEAAMRALDMAGVKTGYPYQMLRPILPWTSFANQTNPAKSATGNNRIHLINSNERTAPIKFQQQIAVPSTSADWCFSPNAYVKKSPYSWTSTGSSVCGVRPVVKLNSKLHFVGLTPSSQELEERCKQLQEKRARAMVDGGPSGAIMRRSNDPPIPPVSSSATVLVGAASKAIVKRSEQTNPSVYKSELASSNPFVINDRADEISLSENPSRRTSSKGSSEDERTTTMNGSKDCSKKKTSFRTPSFLRKRKGAKKENVPAPRA